MKKYYYNENDSLDQYYEDCLDLKLNKFKFINFNTLI